MSLYVRHAAPCHPMAWLAGGPAVYWCPTCGHQIHGSVLDSDLDLVPVGEGPAHR